MVNILHTESSNGWGGQEIRILREAIGMRERGNNVFFLTCERAELAKKAREKGFIVEEAPLSIKKAPFALFSLIKMILKYKIDIVNTHSSADAWLGGIAARLTGRKVIRTRHLSTKIKPGLNSFLLYRALADFTATTCVEVKEVIKRQASLTDKRCLSIPTGVEPDEILVSVEEVEAFRDKWGIKPSDILVGTVCVLRSWKGISTLLQGAKALEHIPDLKWVIVGDGPSKVTFLRQRDELKLSNVIFTGHLENPFNAIKALDIFTLLSYANEGVSQASLQAAYLQKPLITTEVGGLKEVCIPDKTGYIVPKSDPQALARAVLKLYERKEERLEMGSHAKDLVLEKFTFEKTLDAMERAIKYCLHQT